MLTILIILAVYTVLILFFVPLEKIGKWQLSVRASWKKIRSKFDN